MLNNGKTAIIGDDDDIKDIFRWLIENGMISEYSDFSEMVDDLFIEIKEKRDSESQKIISEKIKALLETLTTDQLDYIENHDDMNDFF